MKKQYNRLKYSWISSIGMGLFLLFVIMCSYSCTSPDYRDYIDEGDDIMDELYRDSCMVRYESEHICIYREIVEGESGDFVNVHTQYYNSKRELVAYKRSSKFFNSHCYDGVLSEVMLYSVRNKTPKLEEHTLYKEDGSILRDTLDCIFNYRLDYKLLYDYSLIDNRDRN